MRPGHFHSPGDPTANDKIKKILHGWGMDDKPKRASRKSERIKKKPRPQRER